MPNPTSRGMAQAGEKGAEMKTDSAPFLNTRQMAAGHAVPRGPAPRRATAGHIHLAQCRLRPPTAGRRFLPLAGSGDEGPAASSASTGRVSKEPSRVGARGQGLPHLGIVPSAPAPSSPWARKAGRGVPQPRAFAGSPQAAPCSGSAGHPPVSFLWGFQDKRVEGEVCCDPSHHRNLLRDPAR